MTATVERTLFRQVESPVYNTCGDNSIKLVFRAGKAQKHQIVECARCGLMYAFPRERSNIENYDVEGGAAPLDDESEQVKHTADKLPDYAKIDERLKSLLPNRGKLLEIGSYSGVLTNFFRSKGWQTIGIEPDRRAVDYARRTFECEFLHGTILSAPIEPGSVDAVVMLHVVEHLDDPATNIERIRHILKPGGILAIETPTYDSLMFRLLRRRERSVSCNGHIYFYTTATLTDLLVRNGFKPLRIERVGRTLSFGRLLFNIGVMSKSARIAGALRDLSDRLGLDRRYLYLNMRDMIRIYATAI